MLHRGDLHPYEMKRRFEAAMVDCYLDLDVGTLYYAIRQLEKEGAIDAVAAGARGARRHAHHLSDHAEGPRRIPGGLLPRSSKRMGRSRRRSTAPCSSSTASIRARLAEAIRGRIARLDDLIAKLEPIRAANGPACRPAAEHLFRHIEQQRRLDRDWLEGLLADLEAAPAEQACPASRHRTGAWMMRLRPCR